MRFALSALSALSLSLLSSSAFANSAGVSGQSNKQNQSCNGCHFGGTAPTVTLTGPTELEPGATGQYTLVITGGAAKVGGMNVAVDNSAAKLAAGTGSKTIGDEITHIKPQAFTGNELRFDFSLVAPTTPGTIKIFGAGNSANGDLGSEGDRGSTTTLSVTVPGAKGDGSAEAQGGCSTTGNASLLAFALAAAVLPVLRRRWS
ncbi:MXAN_6652 family MXYO-CTERM-anchored protein [Melittangium boletus]|uniref:MXAN_6652 family MXYO-CTERM-anchored protein n=1 Tax=Melittangium boletus TaxID=83453 RepID=UPI003DA65385